MSQQYGIKIEYESSAGGYFGSATRDIGAIPSLTAFTEAFDLVVADFERQPLSPEKLVPESAPYLRVVLWLPTFLESAGLRRNVVFEWRDQEILRTLAACRVRELYPRLAAEFATWLAFGCSEKSPS